MHAVRTQCEVLDVIKSVFGSILGFFFSFRCSWDVAYLNCHPFLPIFNHFNLFPPHHGDPEKARVM